MKTFLKIFFKEYYFLYYLFAIFAFYLISLDPQPIKDEPIYGFLCIAVIMGSVIGGSLHLSHRLDREIE